MKRRSGFHDVNERVFELDDVLRGPDGGLLAAWEADEVLSQAWDRDELPDNIDDCCATALKIWHQAKRETDACNNRRAWLLTLTFNHERTLS